MLAKYTSGVHSSHQRCSHYTNIQYFTLENRKDQNRNLRIKIKYGPLKKMCSTCGVWTPMISISKYDGVWLRAIRGWPENQIWGAKQSPYLGG